MERSPAARPDHSPPDALSPDAAAGEVDRLIAAGKCKQAVELAKAEHKHSKTPETERRLVHAYLARIEQFQGKGMAEEAATLLALVRERFPAYRDRLLHLELRAAAAGGRMSDLVAPLARGETAAETVACVEANIRQHLVDLPALAECGALPAEHPLRVGATAVWRAFQAATSGPVTDEQLALPEVSRRSPLAAWKMLVRAVAAFYRNDDSACERALESIPPDAAVARLVPVLRAMMRQAPVQGGRAAALTARVTGDDRTLRAALEGIETAFRRADPARLDRCIREAVRACRQSRPALYERLRQHISIACLVRGVPVNEVVRAMGSSRKDAFFWRLIARASELEGAPITAAMYWERFLRHAVHEGMVAEKSMEAAMVYLHAARLLGRVSLGDLARARRGLSRSDVLRSYYRDQPPEVAAAAPRSDREVLEKILSPGWFYERAAEIHPDPETFRQWWSWAESVDLPERFKEDVARRWSENHPRDPHPLLLLSELAEGRKALKLALKHLAAAEALDSLNPRVRQARVRLTLATMWRHFKDGKPHLVEQDLAKLGGVPGMREGDCGAVVTALRAALHALRGEVAEARQEVEAVAAALGPLAGWAIVRAVGQAARLPRDRAWPEVPLPALLDPHEVIRAETRIVRLGSELGLGVPRPAAWDPLINDALRGQACPLSQAELLALGRAAVRRRNPEQAYLASAAGLATADSPAALAGFLLVRAQSLSAAWGWRRAEQCLRAALELARQAHDPALLREVVAEVERHPAVGGGRDRRLPDDLLAEVLRHERAARTVPRTAADADRHVAIIECEPGEPGEFGERGPFDEPYGEAYDDEDEDEDEDDGDVRGFPPGRVPGSRGETDPDLLDLLGPLLDRKGKLPSPEALLRDNPELLLQVLATLAGPDLPLDEASLNALLDEIGGQGGQEDDPPRGFFGRLFGRRGRKRKKRR